MRQHSLSTRARQQNPARVLDTYSEIRDALAEAQEQRAQRDRPTGDGQPGWVAYERAVMVDVTTALLVRHELPINAEEVATSVAQAERLATGHSDYSHKWAIGCAQYIALTAQSSRAAG